MSKQQEQEEDPMEKDLADDAVWKRIQKNTFTRWANEHLKTVNMHLLDLETDFSDGIRLIALCEVLSGRRLPKHSKRPTMRAQKLENVNISLKFLMVDEKIKIVNIDSTDVVDSRLKLILGLIWSLILHYSISMPVWEGEDDSMYAAGPGQKGAPSPKQRLLGWIKNKIPEVPVNNFNTDWNDGKALGALVDALAPGLCPDWPDWKPEDNKKNIEEAMKLSSAWLDIPPLLTPEDISNPKIDDPSMMTYLSQFPNAKLKDGAPLRPRNNPNRVRCYGPGIQPTGVTVGAPTNFTVETFSAGQGKVEVFLENPQGKREPVNVKFNEDRSKTYTCSYTAKMEGAYKVVVKFNGQEVPKSPFTVTVEGVAGDANKVVTKGPGIQKTGVQVGKPTYFDVITKGAGLGQIETIILDPKNKPNTVPMRVRMINEDEYRCEYVAQQKGQHAVNVFFAGRQVPGSPFPVTASPTCDPRKVRATGRGLQPTGVRVGDEADFRVFTEGAGEGKLDVKLIGPDGKAEPVNLKKRPDGRGYDCTYGPKKEGPHIVTVEFGGQEIFKSPFEVNVGPTSNSKIVAYGPGLEGGFAGYPAVFTVDTNGESGRLGFTIEGPSQAKIDCKDNGDGSAGIAYYPSAPGEYAIHILTNGEDIPKSPYVVQIVPKSDFFTNQQEIQLQQQQTQQKQKQTQQTQQKQQQQQKTQQQQQQTQQKQQQTQQKQQQTQQKQQQQELKQQQTESLKKTMVKRESSESITKKESSMSKQESFSEMKQTTMSQRTSQQAQNYDQVRLYNIQHPTESAVPKLNCLVKCPSGAIDKASIIDNNDGTISVEYDPREDGPHELHILMSPSNEPIPGSPFMIHVNSNKAKHVTAVGPGLTYGTQNEPCPFSIFTKGAGAGGLQIAVEGPDKADITCVDNKDGVVSVYYMPPLAGDYKIFVRFAGKDIHGSPFSAKVAPALPRPKPTISFGQLSEVGLRISESEFKQMKASIVSPSGKEEPCGMKVLSNGQVGVSFTPREVGAHQIRVRRISDNQLVAGSPFMINVAPADMAGSKKVELSGAGLQQGKVNVENVFFVDTRESGYGGLRMSVEGPSKAVLQVKDNGDGRVRASYTCTKPGVYHVSVKFGDDHVDGSPFSVNITGTGASPKPKITSVFSF